MPKQACLRNAKSSPIDANYVGIENSYNTFVCCTDACNAEMILVGAGTGAAYFRSKRKSDHISNTCIKNSISFDDSKYNEAKFDLLFAFESMLGKNHSIKPINRGGKGTKQENVGGNKNLRIHTLPLLYAMCLSRGKSSNYNGILINDLLADNENFAKYSKGIDGYKLVETSKYHKVQDEFAFLMNYPAENRGINSWVKIIFDSEKIFWNQYNKLKNSNHIEPIIIAGEWEIVPSNTAFHSQCIIHKESQIYYAEEQ